MSERGVGILCHEDREFYMMAAKRLLSIISDGKQFSTGSEIADHDSFLYGYVHSARDKNIKPEFYPNLAEDSSENRASVRSVTNLAYYSCKFASMSGIKIANELSYKQGYIERVRHDNPFLSGHDDAKEESIRPDIKPSPADHQAI